MTKLDRLTIGLNPHIEALPPYNAGMNMDLARERSGIQDIAGLASNENADGCSPRVSAALATLDPSRYCDPACTQLRGALSRKLGVAVEQIVAGNGSEEMIAAVCRAVLAPGSHVSTIVPGFGLHEIEALAVGARVEKVPMGPGMRFDVAGIVKALQAGPAIFFLSSPSNPVGTGLDRESMEVILDAVLPQTLLVLDEAYVEFREDGAPDGLAMLKETDLSWVALRTFSKAYGLAGLRVGYAVASDPRLARVIAAAKTPFNVNAAAQMAAVAALEDEEWMRQSVARTRSERLRLENAVATLGLFVAPSQTNFLFIDTARDSQGAQQHFLSKGIIVKPWREQGYETFIRVTVGAPAHNDRFIKALEEFVAG